MCRLDKGAIVFIDEIDALAQDRSEHTHEATRRLLSVLLRNVRVDIAENLPEIKF